MLKLYEMADEYRSLLNSICDDENGEVNMTSLKRLDELKDPMEVKCTNIARINKELKAYIKAIATERKLMMKREKSLKNKLERLINYLSVNMAKCNINQIDSPQFRIKLKTTEDSLLVYCKDLVPEKYFDEKVEKVINNDRIKNDLKEGIHVPGAKLATHCKAVIR